MMKKGEERRSFRTERRRWEAVVERDPQAEGRFVYAVVTTGVYCRPSCPARRPKRSNVRFYSGAGQAEQAGFRPCKRCRPDAVSRHQRVVAKVRRLISESEVEPTLATLGEAVGMSPYHLQRVFKQATGLSPKQYSLARRENLLREQLQESPSVTAAIYDAGYDSSASFYSRGSQLLGMAPQAFRRGGEGVVIRFAVFPSRVGDFLVAATDKGLVSLAFGQKNTLLADLEAAFPRARLQRSPEAVEECRRSVLSYLEGQSQTLGLVLDLAPSEFQRLVWAELERIPFGETRSYGEIAQQLGRPGAARAVARACATNPVALAIPCHRVISASGKASGYRWGVELKADLLAVEQSRSQK